MDGSRGTISQGNSVRTERTINVFGLSNSDLDIRRPATAELERTECRILSQDPLPSPVSVILADVPHGFQRAVECAIAWIDVALVELSVPPVRLD
jgi:hypothetical protein